ncbi:hypothetical protein [Embleya scabrispora]|uniref:hypothetical protein n=1 Tax=Embleya scabrispora TaxID=159449 RepID=UPI001319EAB8|nr:hypothetical protein [Embleya scabrispora]MYS78865.1 hypothetical protein [Streptomyces sp. SID5474]
MDPRSWPDRASPAAFLAAALPILIAASVLGGPSAEQARAEQARARQAGSAPPPRTVAAAPAPGARANARPVEITASVFAPNGFALAGVTTIDTAAGPRRVLVLTMNSAHLKDYALTTADTGGNIGLTTRSLDLVGNVRIYLTRLHGCIEGLLCLDFAPDALPLPPIIPPFVFMTDVRAQQAFVHADKLTTDIVLKPLRASPEAAAGDRRTKY